MLYQKKIGSICKWFCFSFLLATSTYVRAQCAGSDNSVTVCNKDQDISTRTFDLFNNLSGSPTPGGTWSTTNPANFFALDTNTGIVDLWRINNFGAHQFVYTNDCGGPNPEMATVTINLGGYPGEDNTDGSANACGDNLAVNLFSFLGSAIDGKVQDFNGSWEEVPVGATGFLVGNIFDAFSAGPGVYTFTYTVGAVDTCPSRVSTIEVEVHPPANPGIPNDLVVCTNEDLSGLTNFNLNNLLSGEDLNGTWSENGTNQLSDLTDNVINVEEINTNFGYGTYTFRYSVFPSHPVCTERFAEVNIIILPALDGTLDPPNFCAGTPYNIPLDYDDSILPNGTYQIDYSIDDSTGTETGVSDVLLTNGQGTLEVSPLLVATNELVNITITNIVGIAPARDVCATINVPQETFLVSNATASAQDICPNTDVTVDLANVLDTLGNLSNDTYDINYVLTDPNSNTQNLIAQNINFSNGDASFNITDSELSVAGQYTIDIAIPASFPINCMITANFDLIPAPQDILLDVIVDNACDATQIDVLVDAPTLSNGFYNVTYEVTELNSSAVLVSNTINFNGGTANYNIDIATLSEGNYTVVLRSTQNDTTLCRTVFDFELQENFAIGGIPEIPQAVPNQILCTNSFAPNTPTLADLSVTATGNISFFDTATDNAELPLNTNLIDGEDYFITSTDPINNCVSSERIQVIVSLVTANMAITTNTNPVFCASENATVADIAVTSPNNGNIVWYDAASGGNTIDTSQPIIDGMSYFAVEQLNGICESDLRLEIIPTVIDPPLPDLTNSDLSICGLDNPTVANLRDLENTINAEIRWFDTPTGGTALLNSDGLRQGAIYYAESFDLGSGCVNAIRVPVTVDLTNCNPDDYGFFVPDGFSPNNDGSNDTFFIPNIEVIFPDFTMEIYNRYGSSLFKGNSSNLFWDGSNGSGIAPNGVYFYIIEFNKEGFAPKQGRLYLNR
ncbi:MAG: gliding motility-associated C-terminal domain-containing protein [Bacteroidota bacterium]